jgi:hypothetical protein
VIVGQIEVIEKILDFRWVRFGKRTHRRGVLRLSEGIFEGLARFFGAGFGLLDDLMLLNPADGTIRQGSRKGEFLLRIVTTNVHLSRGERGSSLSGQTLEASILGGES